MNKRKKSHLNLFYMNFLFFFWATITLSSSATSFSSFSASYFIPLPLTNNSLILFASLSSDAFKEFSINSFLRESTNCFTMSLFCSHSPISLSKICSVSFKLSYFCFNKKALHLLWDRVADLIELGVMVTSLTPTLNILLWSFTTHHKMVDNSVMLSF